MSVGALMSELDAARGWPARWRERARLAPCRVALPECEDPRVLTAAAGLSAAGLARPVLIGRRPVAGEGEETRRWLGADCWHDPADAAWRARAEAWLLARRRPRGLTPGRASVLAREPLWQAAVLAALGEADGLVAGASATTAGVLKAALAAIGPRADAGTVCGVFVMLPPDARRSPLIFADCGVVPQPDETQLVRIGEAAGEVWRVLMGGEPAVAYLSYSTRGSADHPATAAPARAAARLAAARPAWRVAGELQADAALAPEVARAKGVDWRGRAGADVLVFPDLASGNIGYKLVERLGGWRAIGPLLRGLRRPASDLSRGCSTLDIVDAVVVTGLLAAADARE